MRRCVVAALSGLALSACTEKKTQAPAAAAPVGAAAPPSQATRAQTVIEVPQFVISTEPRDIKRGEELFASKGCVACHQVRGGKLVGPNVGGVTARRDEAWIKKMILKPEVMLEEDELAMRLLAETYVPMPNQNVDPDKELPFIMAYLKSVEK